MRNHFPRHSAFIPHPEVGAFSKHLLTLLAQRRELQSQDVQQFIGAAQAGSPPLPTSLYMRPATVGAIQAERTHLQHELCKSAFKDISNMGSSSENSTSLPAGTPTSWQCSVAAAEREGAPLEGKFQTCWQLIIQPS